MATASSGVARFFATKVLLALDLGDRRHADPRYTRPNVVRTGWCFWLAARARSPAERTLVLFGGPILVFAILAMPLVFFLPLFVAYGTLFNCGVLPTRAIQDKSGAIRFKHMRCVRGVPWWRLP